MNIKDDKNFLDVQQHITDTRRTLIVFIKEKFTLIK